MDRIKMFIDCGVPTDACNLKCHYCYIGQRHKFSDRLSEITRTPEEIRIAFAKKRLGGICLINLCASGETLLSRDIISITRALLEEGHYVMIVTNGTLKKRFKEIIELPYELRQRLFIKFSLHYLEFKRLNILEKFVENVDLVKAAGISFTIEATPSDELIPYIEEMKNFCVDKFGALCHISVARDERTEGFCLLSKYNLEQYKKIWEQFNSLFLSFKCSTFGVKRKEFCYAGIWSISVDLQSGNYKQCTYENYLGNIYENVNEKLNLRAVGKKCRMSHCYNSHAYLTLGVIPEIETPTYAEIRNRICEDGSEWLTTKFKKFTSQKLYENNEEYKLLKKMHINYDSLWNECKKEKYPIKAMIKRILVRY